MSRPAPGAYRRGHLPELPRGFFALVGPGAVLVGLAVGAGELLVWPIMTARYGAGIAWAAMLGIGLQLIINLSVGRYTLATGESSYTAFARLSQTWVPVFLILNVVGWILPGWARTCAGALKAITVGASGPGEPWAWTAVTFALVALVMFGPRNVYRSIERITISLVVIMLVGLSIIAIKVGNLDALAELFRGIVNIGFKPPELPTYEMFSAIVFAGAGGTTNLMFAYYLIGKGWGMGEHTRGDQPGRAGYELIDNADNRRRWTVWLRHVRSDQLVFFGIVNAVTILLFILAALVVLHAEGIVPSQEMLVLQEARILERVWGMPGARLFMAVGIACLFSTQLTLLDGVARSCTDLMMTNYPAVRAVGFTRCYRSVAIVWMVVGTGLTWAWSALPPFMFLLSAGFFGGIAMAVYCPLLLAANHRLLPAAYRPGSLETAAMSAVSLFYGVFALTSIWVVVSRLISPL